jgi:hypothetical protein
VLLGIVVLVVARWRRRVRPLVGVAIGAALVFEMMSESGFSWVDGLLATRRQYVAGIASSRPLALYLVANLAALAIVLGPATAVALARLRDRRLWVVVGGALAAIALADVSGMSKAEVERIWLPFLPFVIAACAVLTEPSAPDAADRSGRTRVAVATRGWLALQIGFAVLLEVIVRTGW